jgi:hypothetical protein
MHFCEISTGNGHFGTYLHLHYDTKHRQTDSLMVHTLLA